MGVEGRARRADAQQERHLDEEDDEYEHFENDDLDWGLIEQMNVLDLLHSCNLNEI